MPHNLGADLNSMQTAWLFAKKPNDRESLGFLFAYCEVDCE